MVEKNDGGKMMFPSITQYANFIVANGWSDGTVNILFGVELNGEKVIGQSVAVPLPVFRTASAMFAKMLAELDERQQKIREALPPSGEIN